MSDEKDHPLMERLRKRAGDDIRAAREAKGLTQTQLAELADTNQQTVDRIERGVTMRSKAYPAILKALDLEMPFSADVDQTIDKVRGAPSQSPMPRRLKDAIKHFGNATGGSAKVPIFARSRDGLVLINAIPRTYPVELVDGAYGLLVIESEMEPALRRGDIVIVNPFLPLQPDSEVVVTAHHREFDALYLATLSGETESNWKTETWSPKRTHMYLKHDDEHTIEMIVAKISKHR